MIEESCRTGRSYLFVVIYIVKNAIFRILDATVMFTVFGVLMVSLFSNQPIGNETEPAELELALMACHQVQPE
jgi:hypothetical protein